MLARRVSLPPGRQLMIKTQLRLLGYWILLLCSAIDVFTAGDYFYTRLYYRSPYLYSAMDSFTGGPYFYTILY